MNFCGGSHSGRMSSTSATSRSQQALDWAEGLKAFEGVTRSDSDFF